MANTSDIAQLQTYVERHFVPFNELAELGGTTTARVTALIAARALPGPIYSLWSNGAYASPIGGSFGPPPDGAPTHWYAPTAAWWIRRAHDLTPEAAASAFVDRFTADFVTRLAREPEGQLGYPAVYATGAFDPDAAMEAARAEWQDWLDGGYGVCLRQANAHHAITKTCRRASVLAITDQGRASTLSAAQRDTLLTTLEELDAVMLPFAPHQRPSGTPGLWIDTILGRYGLGRTREMAQPPIQPIPQLRCA